MADTHVPKQSTFLGHPIGLYVLFFTEMWERFSYYGMRALLLLYMVNYFKWTQQDASFYYKWYTSLVYLTPLLGGYLADRYLGNRLAIIIGATLMAVGHFLMAFEEYSIFVGALVFLIIGNGFFKPNMSVQVGRLYPQNDPRRDSAYTIFYMGINLGAFLSPLICGWLQANTKWSYHAGFAAAGVGMLLGLVCYLVGLRWVREVPESVEYEGPGGPVKEEKPADHYMSEAEAAQTPSAMPRLSAAAPMLFWIFAALSIPGAALLYWVGLFKADDAVAFGVGGAFTCIMGAYVLSKVGLALRDRVLVIFFIGLFVVFFWSAFEQAGNAMNLFADKTTDRHLTQSAPLEVYPQALPGTEEAEGAAAASSGNWLTQSLNPVPTPWFQSINALAIFILAPVFAWLWVALPKRGIDLSIPTKVGIGVLLQAAAFALMIWSITFENQPSSTPLPELPRSVVTDDRGQIVFRDAPDLEDEEGHASFGNDELPPSAELHIVHGGRIEFDAAEQALNMRGVLADTDRDRLLRATAPAEFVAAARELTLASQEATVDVLSNGVSVTLETVPPGFDLRYAGMAPDALSYDAETKVLTTRKGLLDKDYKAILVAGADPIFRDALGRLYIGSAQFKVSSNWLLWFYILCTVGELCLSPVGLSMVSKLAPAKFATMMMGVWLMTSFFGNYVASFAGESYGTVHPVGYFAVVAAVVGGAALVCFLFVRVMKSMMHGVK